MVGHDAPGFHKLVDAIVDKPENDSREYWKQAWRNEYQKNISLRNRVVQLESYLRIADIYIDKTQQAVRDAVKQAREREQA